MSYKLKRIWSLVIVFLTIIELANVQFAMPMCLPPMFPPPPPPVFPMPVPVPIMASILYPMPGGFLSTPGTSTSTVTTTTTTTEAAKPPDTIAVAVPVPVPMAVPMAVPSFMPPPTCQGPPPRPKDCPPCPPCVCRPSCTPSFFSYCSPCHMKCRCRNQDDAPEPMPKGPVSGAMYAMPPPPVVVVPFPPPIAVPVRQQRRKPKKRPKQKYSSCSDESSDTSSSEYSYLKKGRRTKRKRYGIVRRSLHSLESENELVKPMLSYISENGDVKFKTRISNDDVAELLGENSNENRETLQIVAKEDKGKKPKIVVLSKNNENRKPKRHKKVFLRGGVTNHVLSDGRKELIFNPSGDKKISNLSVSFQIS